MKAPRELHLVYDGCHHLARLIVADTQVGHLQHGPACLPVRQRETFCSAHNLAHSRMAEYMRVDGGRLAYLPVFGRAHRHHPNICACRCRLDNSPNGTPIQSLVAAIRPVALGREERSIVGDSHLAGVYQQFARQIHVGFAEKNRLDGHPRVLPIGQYESIAPNIHWAQRKHLRHSPSTSPHHAHHQTVAFTTSSGIIASGATSASLRLDRITFDERTGPYKLPRRHNGRQSLPVITLGHRIISLRNRQPSVSTRRTVSSEYHHFGDEEARRMMREVTE